MFFISGQYRTIPALRLKHRSGGCGTSLAVSALRIMRYCLKASEYPLIKNKSRPQHPSLPGGTFLCRINPKENCPYHSGQKPERMRAAVLSE